MLLGNYTYFNLYKLIKALIKARILKSRRNTNSFSPKNRSFFIKRGKTGFKASGTAQSARGGFQSGSGVWAIESERVLPWFGDIWHLEKRKESYQSRRIVRKEAPRLLR